MAECVTKVELHLSCRGLLNKDTLSKSDPIVALLMQDKNGKWYEVRKRRLLQNDILPSVRNNNFMQSAFVVPVYSVEMLLLVLKCLQMKLF